MVLICQVTLDENICWMIKCKSWCEIRQLIPVWVALLVLAGLNWSPDLAKLISKTEYVKLFKKT